MTQTRSCYGQQQWSAFFRAVELTVPMRTSYNAIIHLTWGDVTIDNPKNPIRVCVFVKCSKCDQLGNGVHVYLGKTDT